MPTTIEIREALRTLHGVAPEAAGVVETHIDLLEDQITLHTSEDAFRAFVLSQAQQAGVTQALLQRIDSTTLVELTRADAARAETLLLTAKDREMRALTAKQVLSQPVVLAAVGIISTLLTGGFTLLLHMIGASG
jgi:hypothetical protein